MQSAVMCKILINQILVKIMKMKIKMFFICLVAIICAIAICVAWLAWLIKFAVPIFHCSLAMALFCGGIGCAIIVAFIFSNVETTPNEKPRPRHATKIFDFEGNE